MKKLQLGTYLPQKLYAEKSREGDKAPSEEVRAMTHGTHGMNNIALKFISGIGFTVLDLQYYNWRWVKVWELIEVEFSRGKAILEVCKLETGEDRLIAVVRPVKQEVAP